MYIFLSPTAVSRWSRAGHSPNVSFRTLAQSIQTKLTTTKTTKAFHPNDDVDDKPEFVDALDTTPPPSTSPQSLLDIYISLSPTSTSSSSTVGLEPPRPPKLKCSSNGPALRARFMPKFVPSSSRGSHGRRRHPYPLSHHLRSTLVKTNSWDFFRMRLIGCSFLGWIWRRHAS